MRNGSTLRNRNVLALGKFLLLITTFLFCSLQKKYMHLILLEYQAAPHCSFSFISNSKCTRQEDIKIKPHPSDSLHEKEWQQFGIDNES